jgi:hypothetical protein
MVYDTQLYLLYSQSPCIVASYLQAECSPGGQSFIQTSLNTFSHVRPSYRLGVSFIIILSNSSHNEAPSSVYALEPGYHYIGPEENDPTENECKFYIPRRTLISSRLLKILEGTCSTPVYEFMSACAGCQHGTWIE